MTPWKTLKINPKTYCILTNRYDAMELPLINLQTEYNLKRIYENMELSYNHF